MGRGPRRRRLDSAGFILEQVVGLDVAAKNARFPIGRKSCVASNGLVAAPGSSLPPCEPASSLRTWRGSPQAAKWSAYAGSSHPEIEHKPWIAEGSTAEARCRSAVLLQVLLDAFKQRHTPLALLPNRLCF
jgi:hypothetical protein